jgi:hypothetical protein
VSDVRSPLGFGDATGIAKWCHESLENHGIHLWMIYLETVRVKHAKGTTRQVKEQEEYHATHALFQKIPYIPVWRGDVSKEGEDDHHKHRVDGGTEGSN